MIDVNQHILVFFASVDSRKFRLSVQSSNFQCLSVMVCERNNNNYRKCHCQLIDFWLSVVAAWKLAQGYTSKDEQMLLEMKLKLIQKEEHFVSLDCCKFKTKFQFSKFKVQNSKLEIFKIKMIKVQNYQGSKSRFKSRFKIQSSKLSRFNKFKIKNINFKLSRFKNFNFTAKFNHT